MRIFLSAGEASGEQYAVQLMEAIRRRLLEAERGTQPGAEAAVEFFGLGGQRMEAIGFERIVRAEDVAVMGITEIIRHIPRIYREYRRLKRSLRDRRPDVAVLIDFPDVNLGLARTCKRLGIPVIFFVSPQVWAWKKHRLRQIRRNIDRMLVIFPFEEPFYRERGVVATFVGHPLAELPRPTISRVEFAAQTGLDPEKQWVGLLPGSRPAEIRLNLPTMLAAAELVRKAQWEQHGLACEFLLPLAPTLTPEQVAGVKVILDTFDSQRGRATASGRLRVVLTRDARATLHHARASVVASGTATVEAALIGSPFLVVYRVSPLTYAIARRVVTVPQVAMANLVAGRRVVPELIQHDFTPAKVTSTLNTLLNDESARQSMEAELQRIRTLLAAPASVSGANRAETGAIEAVATATLLAAHAFLSAQDAVTQQT